jgi:pyruvate dehydrogenase complex dehydrogenase (E1) component
MGPQGVHQNQSATAAFNRVNVAGREPPIYLASTQAGYAAGIRDRSRQNFHGWRRTFEGALLNNCRDHRDIPLYATLLLGVAGYF